MTSARSTPVLLLAFLAASCNRGGGGDGDSDAEDVVEEDAAGDAIDEDGAEDVVEEDAGEEDGPGPCTVPGLDPGLPVLVADPGAEIGEASAAFGGGVVGVGWNDGRLVDVVTNEEVYFQALEPGGDLVGGEVRVSEASLASRPPAIVWASDRFVLLWGDDRALPAGDLYLGAVDAEGTSIGSETRATTGGANAMFADAVWTGSEIGAAWTDNRDATMDVYFARVTADGAMEGSIVRVSNADGSSFHPAVAWTGSRALVAWDDPVGRSAWEPRIYLSALDASGVVSGPTMISPDPSDAKTPAVAWGGGLLAACWEDFRDSRHEVHCGTFDGAGAPATADARIGSLAGNTMSAALSISLVARDGGFAVAWSDEDGTPYDSEVYFALLSPTLEVAGGDEPLTDTAGALTSVSLVATGAASYGVAYVLEDGAGADEDTLHYLPFRYCE